jgi:Domain of unknown function (DUF4253)
MGVRQLTTAALLLGAIAARAAPPAQKTHEPIALPEPKTFAEAVAAIERVTGAKGGALDTSSGSVPLAEGRAFSVDSNVAARLLAGSHAPFRKAGFYLFRYERSFGMEGDKDRLGLLATSDRSAVVRRMGTADARHGLTTEKIVAWLDELAKEEPFDLTEVGADYLAGTFARSPKDAAGVARRSAEIAPDLVAGRASTLALLTEEIRVNRTLYLIW